MTHSNHERHYFDWAAAGIPLPASGEAAPFGNPSALYREGRQARQALEEARGACAAALGVPPEHIYFSSGGTESNSIILHSLLFRPGGPALAVSAVEHPSVRENARALQAMGKKVLYIKADGDGRVSPGQLEKLLGRERNIRMVSVMWVNNETGAVMDIASLSAVCGAQVHFHCDMVQGLGKLPCSIQDMNIDSASMSAHKIGGPRGVGLLYLRKKVQALYSGGEQERGLRPGTENVQGIIACAAALKMRTANISGDFAAAQERMDYLLGKLSMLDRFSPIPRERSIGDARFSPYILQCTLRGIPGEVMVRALDAEGFSISTGSACSSSSPDRPVLKAMGINNTDALEGIRISQGWSTTMEEMDLLVMAIRKILKNL